jgi:hypothetical protein
VSNRFSHIRTRTILDVMPLDEKILGFSNRWYKPAMDSSVVHKVAEISLRSSRNRLTFRMRSASNKTSPLKDPNCPLFFF